MSRKCLLCSKTAADPFIPFCSERCKMKDLGYWFQEVYTIPVEERGPEILEDGNEKSGQEMRERN